VSAVTETVVVTAETSESALSTDDLFATLSNARRRAVLAHLDELEDTDSVTVRELTAAVASRENDCPPEELTYKQRKRVYTALHQRHLPKMADLGVIAYDGDRGTVSPTEAAAVFDVHIAAATRNDVSSTTDHTDTGGVDRWNVVYLVVAALGTVAALADWLELVSFGVSTEPLLATVVVAVGLVAGTQLVVSARARPAVDSGPDVADPNSEDGTAR
jgi:predicted transcriptional regulator